MSVTSMALHPPSLAVGTERGNLETKMRKLLLIGTALVGLSCSAFAADRPIQPAPSPVVASDPFRGWFLGFEAGYGWGDAKSQLGSLKFSPDGALVGGSITYRSPVASGLYLGLTSNFDWHGGDDTVAISKSISAKLDNRWLGATMLQVGWSPMTDLLFYGQGGVAYGSKKASISGKGFSVTDTEWGVGWAAGGGVEYSLRNWAPNWSVKLDYTHYDLGNPNFGFGVGSGVTIGTKASLKDDVVKLGVNYKFGL